MNMRISNGFFLILLLLFSGCAQADIYYFRIMISQN